MISYTIRRLLQFIPTIFVISLVVFILLNVIPGSVARMSMDLRRAADPVYIRNFNKKWGLDQPVHIRYIKYISGLLKGDLGKSFLRNESVNDMIAGRLWPTIKLAIFALCIAAGLGIPLGFYAALHSGKWIDIVSSVGAVAGISLPQFWLGLLLMFFFCVKLSILPTSGYGDGKLSHMILPSITLGMGYMALLTRTTRAAVLEVLSADYIRTARSKGLSEFKVNWSHVTRNTMVLVMTAVGLQFGALIGETVIVEKVFALPGIGSLLVDSIFQRDIQLTQGCVLVLISVFLFVNLLVDLLYVLIDPRIEYK